uniref:Uncharacterized protein n=1 Tax=Arundo donax TaxID=35708 RepID=A0A0A9BNG1_ARUDO
MYQKRVSRFLQKVYLIVLNSNTKVAMKFLIQHLSLNVRSF